MSQTRVYSYGAKRPTTHAQEVSDHYFLSNRYRNDLCALDRLRREKTSEAVRKHFPDIAAAEMKIAEIDAALERKRSEIRKENSGARRKQPSKESAATAKAMRAERSAVYEKLKAMKADAYGPADVDKMQKDFGRLKKEIQSELRKKDVSQHPKIIAADKSLEIVQNEWLARVPAARLLRKDIDEIEANHRRREKELYKKSGVHFGTRLAVINAAKSFRQGAPPSFKRYRGDGKVGVQVQKSEKNGNTVRDVLGQTKGQIAIDEYDPGIDRKQVATVRMRIGSDKEKQPIWSQIRTVMHRPMPEDAQIKWAFLQRRRVGTRHVHRMQFTLNRDGWNKPQADRGSVGIDVGWRLVPEGMRVAYWMGNDGREGELVLPTKLLERMGHVDELQSERDRVFNAVLPVFCEWHKVNRDTLPEWMVKRCAGKDGKFSAHAWRSQNRLAALVAHWQKNRIADDDKSDDAEVRRIIRAWHISHERERKTAESPGIFGLLDLWRREDELWYNRQERLRERTIGWRNEIYKAFAAILRTEYRTAIVEKINWREMQEKDEAEEDTGENVLVGKFRVAAVGKLVELVAQSMREIVRKDPKDTSRIHHDCGQPSGEASPASLLHTCSHCLTTFDQDRNSAMILLGNALATA